MKKFVLSVVFVVLLVALGAAYFQWQAQRHGAVTPPAVVDAPPPLSNGPSAPSEQAASSGPRYPIPAPSTPPIAEVVPAQPLQEQSVREAPAQVPLEPDAAPSAVPLPNLGESNALMTEVFTELFGAQPMRELFNADELVRRFVVTVDNLPNKKLPRQQLLVKRVAGPFLVMGEGDQQVIGPDNAARYVPYVQLAVHADAKQLVDVYVRFYPLFQAAYAELGEPNAYFNDRLVEVIDHLLDAPRVVEPIHVVQPKVFYEYAAPGLEALSAGHKIMLRMGRANAEQIKTKLRGIRQALTNEAPQLGSEPAADSATQSPEDNWKIVP